MLIDIIAGARPNFVKIATLIHALEKHLDEGGPLRYRIIHTGQHYDARMSGDFFTQLGIPAPHVNLQVGSGTQAEQTGAIMLGYEKLLAPSPSRLCLVVGDVNSTMACAITAQKMNIKVAHIEAGIRSNDWSMPEEINRMVTDSVTNWFFTTSRNASDNLLRSGIEKNRIFLVGNTMIDTLLKNMPCLKRPVFWEQLNLQNKEYFVVTLHRPANVDDQHSLAALLDAIVKNTKGIPVIMPVHPRTAKNLENLHSFGDNLHFVDPQPYLEFNYLVKHAKAVITDSGGITEEATVMGVPCMTMRDNTERPETIETGTNELIGTDPSALRPSLEKLFAGGWKKGSIPEYWDGKTGERIILKLEQLLIEKH